VLAIDDGFLQRHNGAMTFRVIAALAGLLMLSACGDPPAAVRSEEILTAGRGAVRYRVQTVASNLEVPWALAFTADGSVLLTERPGRIRLIRQGTLQERPIAVIGDVQAEGESGLMDLILHPDFSRNGWVYVSYAYGTAGSKVRVVRYRFTGSAFMDRRPIIEGIPAARFHAGCRLGFGPDGKLYVTTGDATDRNLAQQLGSLAGKTLRLNDDGSIPPDNPFAGRPGARPEIWSYGHRNAQGIDWQPGTGLQFQTEHGPSGFDGPGGGDEINIVEAGKNYGWPTIHHRESGEGMMEPLLEYSPALAPASGRFYAGNAFPEFRGSLLIGCLRGKCILSVQLDGRKVRGEERLLSGQFGRVRAVAEGPDGAIYFTTSNRDGRGAPAPSDDRVLRLVPAE
jgi:glucose/arabinose dehydrogenase